MALISSHLTMMSLDLDHQLSAIQIQMIWLVDLEDQIKMPSLVSNLLQCHLLIHLRYHNQNQDKLLQQQILVLKTQMISSLVRDMEILLFQNMLMDKIQMLLLITSMRYLLKIERMQAHWSMPLEKKLQPNFSVLHGKPEMMHSDKLKMMQPE